MMTNERKRAALILTATFIVGIIIGALIPGFFGKMRGHKGGKPEGNDKRSYEFVQRFYHTVKPDSDQLKRIRPFVELAASKIDTLESNSRGEVAIVIDSLKIQLKSILSQEQLNKLNKYSGRRGKRGDKH